MTCAVVNFVRNVLTVVIFSCEIIHLCRRKNVVNVKWLRRKATKRWTEVRFQPWSFINLNGWLGSKFQLTIVIVMHGSMICTVIVMNLPTHLVWTIFESSFIILKEEILEHMTYHCRFVPHSKQRCPRPTSARGTRADNTLNYCHHGSIHSQPVARLDPLIWKRPPPPLVAEENLQSNTEPVSYTHLTLPTTASV